MSKTLIAKTKQALFDIGSQLNYTKQHDLPYWENHARISNSDYTNLNLKATKESITKLEGEVTEIETLLAGLIDARDKHRTNLEADIAKTQGELHDLELELEDMKYSGDTMSDEFNDLDNLVFGLIEFIVTCEEALDELDA